MAIAKRHFYEGAALHQLVVTGQVRCIVYRAPFFIVNDKIMVLLKYTTRSRSPWQFTFSITEQAAFARSTCDVKIMAGLVCGGDGVVALESHAFARIVGVHKAPASVSCRRSHGKHYSVRGPNGHLEEKVASADWKRILG